MFIDPVILNWIIIAAASFAAMMIGYSAGRKGNDSIIAGTISYLSDEGFVRSYTDKDGELHLIKLNEDMPNGRRRKKNTTKA